MDHRSARGARARAVREDSARPRGGEGAAAAIADAGAGGPAAGADGFICGDRARTGTERIRSGTVWAEDAGDQGSAGRSGGARTGTDAGGSAGGSGARAADGERRDAP